MSKIDDGGPAFPQSCTSHGYSAEVEGGISMRDWFAGQCMNQMILLSQDKDGGWSTENVAAGCYNLADAMLKARKAGEA